MATPSRPLEETIEIPLTGGIVSNASPLDIGARPLQLINGVWGWRYPAVDTTYTPDQFPPHFLRMPTSFPPRSAITYDNDPAMFLDIAFTFSTQGNQRVIIGTDSTQNFQLWRGDTGVEIVRDASVPVTGIAPVGSPYPACSAYWSTPGNGANIGSSVNEGTLFFSHRDISRICYLNDTDTTFRSMESDPVANAPGGADALTVHIDRLWMAKRNSTNIRTNIWYTDPFDAETIRGESFVPVDDIVTALIPSVPGQIDSSGQAHLFIGCGDSIWCIDGDPTLNNAVRRQVAAGLGVYGPLGVANSQYGVFFVGTDNQIHLASPDLRQITPIALPIGNYIGYRSTGSLSPSRTSLCWFAPYLLYFPSGAPDVYFVCDFSNPQQPTWWEARPAGTFSSIAIVKASTTGHINHTPSGVAASSAVWTAGKLTTSTGHFIGFDRFTKAIGTYPDGHESTRQQSLTTGVIHKPGFRTVIKTVALETTQKANAYAWTVTANTEHPNTATLRRTISTAVRTSASHSASLVAKHVYAPTGTGAAQASGEYVTITIAGPNTSQYPETQAMDLQKITVVAQFIPVGTDVVRG
jgi:hypothetical protein